MVQNEKRSPCPGTHAPYLCAFPELLLLKASFKRPYFSPSIYSLSPTLQKDFKTSFEQNVLGTGFYCVALVW